MTETVDTHDAGDQLRTLSIIGAGRAGTALAGAATAHGWTVSATVGRPRGGMTAAAAARGAALTLITVPDSEVTRVAAQIGASGMALHGRVVAHTAASLGPEAIAAVRQTGAAVGVAHPLQALVGARSAPLLERAYFGIGGDGAALSVLRRFVADVGANSLQIPSCARAVYHAAAVLAGNAPLVLLERATTLLVDAGVDPARAHDALAALLEGTARNARAVGPASALTGPVARNDAATVRAHLDALSADDETRALYIVLARQMLDIVGRAGRESVARVLDDAAAPGSRVTSRVA